MSHASEPRIIEREQVVVKIVEKPIIQDCPIHEIKTTITREIRSLTPEEATKLTL